MVSHKCAEKLNKPTGKWEALCPLRVVGFAYELRPMRRGNGQPSTLIKIHDWIHDWI